MRRAPRTREEIERTLAVRGLAPIHRFGQNFLVRKGALESVLAASEVSPGDLILEPGPGLGGLTDDLLQAGARVVAAEIDQGLCAHLREVFAGDAGFSLVEGDVMGRAGRLALPVDAALQAEFLGAPERPFRVVSNLPYQITSPFIAALANFDPMPVSIGLMLQAEMGDVLRARPGSDAYSSLSFLCAVTFDVEVRLHFGCDAFWPVPAVQSVFLLLRKKATAKGLAPTEWGPLVRRLFQSRRKRLGKTFVEAWVALVAGGAPECAREGLRVANIDENCRIDAVAPEQVLFAIESARGCERQRKSP